jgi:hypothetical protein
MEKTLTKFRGFFLAMVDLFLTRIRGGLTLFPSTVRGTPLGLTFFNSSNKISAAFLFAT